MNTYSCSFCLFSGAHLPLLNGFKNSILPFRSSGRRIKFQEARRIFSLADLGLSVRPTSRAQPHTPWAPASSHLLLPMLRPALVLRPAFHALRHGKAGGAALLWSLVQRGLQTRASACGVETPP